MLTVIYFFEYHTKYDGVKGSGSSFINVLLGFNV